MDKQLITPQKSHQAYPRIAIFFLNPGVTGVSNQSTFGYWHLTLHLHHPFWAWGVHILGPGCNWKKTMLKHLRVRIMVDTKIDSNLIPIDSIIRFQCESYKCSKLVGEAFRNENNASWTWGTGPSRLKGKSAHSGDKKHHIFIDHATPISTSYHDIFDLYLDQKYP